MREERPFDPRLLKGAVHWEDDERSVSQERILPPDEESRKKTLVSHQDAVDGEAASPGASDLLEGQVLEILGEWSRVQVGQEVLQCRIRGKLKDLELSQRSIVAVGDRVRVQKAGASEGLVLDIRPRKNELSRQSLGHRHIAHVVAANIDQMVIVSSVDYPPLWSGLIDRYLVVAHARNFSPVICINKSDLDVGGLGARFAQEYRSLGYPVILASAQSGQGMDELKGTLKGKASVFMGQSGVGKSTLLNVLEPSLNLRIGDIGGTTRRGRHTTTSARLIPLSFGAHVVDTPGIRDFLPFQLQAEEIHDGFIEVQVAAGKCRFQDCRHDQEPGCAVRSAVESGEILERRYLSFRELFDAVGE